MNNSSMSPGESSLQEINKEHAVLFIPAIAITCLHMVVGLLGNSMVCYFYGFKAKMTPTSVFILLLAVCDLITCTVGMPHEIVHRLQFYTYMFGNRYVCKTISFISVFAIQAAALTLQAISIDRYRHICAVAVYQATVKDAMKQCAIVITLALSISWPAIILIDIEAIPLPVEYGDDVQGTTCSRRTDLSTYNFAWDVVYMIVVSIAMTIIVVLYFRISKVLYVHRQNLRQFDSARNSDNHSQRIDRITAKVTTAMSVISTVFILSYIPCLCLMTWRSIDGRREDQFLSGTELLMFQIGLQSFLLSSSLNPWIYGIFNSEFRQFYCKRVCSCFRNTSAVPITSTCT